MSENNCSQPAKGLKQGSCCNGKYIPPQRDAFRKKTLNISLLLVLALVMVCLFQGCAEKGFEKNSEGLEYRIEDSHVENMQVKVGDVMDLSVYFYIQDSLWFQKRLLLSLDTARHGGGSIETGFAMLHLKDSAVFRLNALPFYEHSMKTQYPQGLSLDDRITIAVKLHNIKTKEEIQREREAVQNQSKIEEEQEIQFYLQKRKLKNDNPMGLYVNKLVKGTGKKIKPGKKTTVHYVASFLTGQEFDSSHKRNTPFEFMFGVGEVITAWEMGLQDARVGDKIHIITPSWYAYGEEGVEGIIPPFSPLSFEIEIIDAE